MALRRNRTKNRTTPYDRRDRYGLQEEEWENAPIFSLIDECKLYPILWETTLIDVGDNETKNTAWLNISLKVGKDIIDCQNKWYSLRSEFEREIRMIELVSNYTTGWIFFDKLNFLAAERPSDWNGTVLRNNEMEECTFWASNETFPKIPEQADSRVTASISTVSSNETGQRIFDHADSRVTASTRTVASNESASNESGQMISDHADSRVTASTSTVASKDSASNESEQADSRVIASIGTVASNESGRRLSEQADSRVTASISITAVTSNESASNESGQRISDHADSGVTASTSTVESKESASNESEQADSSVTASISPVASNESGRRFSEQLDSRVNASTVASNENGWRSSDHADSSVTERTVASNENIQRSSELAESNFMDWNGFSETYEYLNTMTELMMNGMNSIKEGMSSFMEAVSVLRALKEKKERESELEKFCTLMAQRLEGVDYKTVCDALNKIEPIISKALDQ